MDYAGLRSYSLSKNPIVWGMSWYTPSAFSLYFGVDDWYAYDYSGIEGIMLVDYYGKPGAGQSYFWPLDVYFNTFFPDFMK